jgi:hypothetical protein
MESLPCLENIQALLADRFEYSKQLSPLGGLPIPKRIHVKNPGIDSNWNILWILKWFNPSGKNLINSPKVYLDLIFSKVNLVGHTCMQDLGVPRQLSKWIALKIRSLNLK